MLVAQSEPARPAYDSRPTNDGHVIIAGFGRFGQIVARVLRVKRHPVHRARLQPEQVDFVRRFGNQVFYGDASRLDLLRAAGAAQRARVRARDRRHRGLGALAELVREHFPS